MTYDGRPGDWSVGHDTPREQQTTQLMTTTSPQTTMKPPINNHIASHQSSSYPHDLPSDERIVVYNSKTIRSCSDEYGDSRPAAAASHRTMVMPFEIRFRF